jgi:hypothetical protein
MAIDINITTTFLGNTDTPNTYAGQGGKVVSVKSDATGLEFTTISGADTNIYNTNGTLTANRTVTHNGNTLTFNGKTQVQSPSASASDTAFAVRNNTNTDYLFNQYANGEWRTKTLNGYFFEFWNYGNNFPAFTMEAPNGGELQQRFRWNDVNKASFALNSAGNIFNINTNGNVTLEGRHIIDFVSNNIHFKKSIDGEWLFTNDATALQTPEAGVRALLIASSGQTALKTVGKVNFNSIPTSNVGLVTGDLYIDTAANILVNGDLILARKV